MRLRYRSGWDEETERLFDPYGVAHRTGYWYAVGHDHLRHGLRVFRLDRVLEAERLLVEEDAGLAPMCYQGTTRLIETFIKDFVYHQYGGSLDLKLYRVQG